MRILHLAWEYPPVMYGGLGRHVHALANAQAANGHDVTVITQGARDAAGGGGSRPAGARVHADGPAHGDGHGDEAVRVVRAGAEALRDDPHDLLSRVARMEEGFTAAGELLVGEWSPDVVHAHDWMVGHAAVRLREVSAAPLVATIHATEAGRNRGWITSDLSTTIHCLEWWLAHTADAVIACSHAMADEIAQLFEVRAARVIANGIDLTRWTPPNGAADRMRAANAGAAPLLAYTGRVEWEKGVQTVLAALPRLRRNHPGLRLLVAGRGSYLPRLQDQARQLGLGDSTRFLGWVSEEDLRAVVTVSDLAIAPSLYEPFGLVALEAAALGTPVVVAETGGLAEFAGGGERARTFRPGDPEDLAEAVEADLAAPEAARERARRASTSLTVHYDWRVIAEATAEVYQAAVDRTGSSGEPARYTIDPPRFAAPMGRLLDRSW